MMDVKISWIEDVESFNALEHEWRRLADHDEMPFVRHAWFAAWWAAFGGGKKLRICTARDTAGLAAVFPLARHAGQLEPLANAHTPAFAPLSRDDAALRAVIDAALDESPTLLLQRIPAEHRAFPSLCKASDAHRRATLVQSSCHSPYVQTIGPVSAYWARLSPAARRSFLRCRRHLDERNDVSLSILEPPQDIEAELARGFAVEGSGWKSRQGSAIANARETVTFYTELARRFARLGKLRLSVLRFGDRVVAFNYNLLDHGRVWALKGGYDVEFSRYAPGLLLTLAEVERCFEAGLEGFELLGDDASWKRKFTGEVRAHRDVLAAERKPLPLARYAYRRYVRPYLRRAHHQLFPGQHRG